MGAEARAADRPVGADDRPVGADAGPDVTNADQPGVVVAGADAHAAAVGPDAHAAYYPGVPAAGPVARLAPDATPADRPVGAARDALIAEVELRRCLLEGVRAARLAAEGERATGRERLRDRTL